MTLLPLLQHCLRPDLELVVLHSPSPAGACGHTLKHNSLLSQPVHKPLAKQRGSATLPDNSEPPGGPVQRTGFEAILSIFRLAPDALLLENALRTGSTAFAFCAECEAYALRVGCITHVSHGAKSTAVLP